LFIPWGALIARRNIGRLSLAILCIALATLVYFQVAFVGQHRLGRAAATESAFFGGDVLVYPNRMATPYSTLDTTGVYQWGEWQSPLGPYGLYYPEVTWSGGPMLAPLPHETVLEALEQNEDVTWIYPYVVMPAFVDPGSGNLCPVYLRARLPEYDEELGFEQSIVDGSYFGQHPADFEVLVDAHRSGRGTWSYMLDNRPYMLDVRVPPVGRTVQLYVPGPGKDAAPDFGALRPVPVTVAGHFSLDTRLLHPKDVIVEDYSRDSEPRRGAPPTALRAEQLYLSTPELVMEWTAFTELLRATGHDHNPLPVVYAAGIRGRAAILSVVEKLRAALPGALVVPVADMVIKRPLASEPISQKTIAALKQAPRLRSDYSAPTAPQWVVDAVIIITYLIAGLLFVGSIYPLAVEQRSAIAAFRALGAYTYQAVGLLFVQLLIVGGLGMVAGLVLCGAVTAAQGSPAASALAWAFRLVLRQMLIHTLVIVLGFGGLAALRAALGQPAEVLKNE